LTLAGQCPAIFFVSLTLAGHCPAIFCLADTGRALPRHFLPGRHWPGIAPPFFAWPTLAGHCPAIFLPGRHWPDDTGRIRAHKKPDLNGFRSGIASAKVCRPFT